MFSSIKARVKGYLGRRFSVYKYPNHNKFAGLIVSQEPIILVDIGANTGGFALKLKRDYGLHFESIVLVEPDPRCLPLLERAAGEFRQSGASVDVINTAIGRTQGVVDFYQTRDAAHNSLLKPISFDYQAVTVRCITGKELLEAAALSKEGPPAAKKVLKVDVQGKEYDVLASFGTDLENFDYIVSEYTFAEFYEGGSSLSDFFSVLDTQFELVSILSQIYDDKGVLQYCNLLFMRKDT